MGHVSTDKSVNTVNYHVMYCKKHRKKSKRLTVSKIFIISVLFFAFFSFFGAYSYHIYSIPWFIMYYVYDMVFLVGLKSGKIVLTNGKSRRNREPAAFSITARGAKILWVLCIVSLLSFVYFVYTYRATLGGFAFGSYTSNLYEEGRSGLEKITLLLMQFGGDSAFLILSADKSKKYKKLKALSCITLFLPGLRYLLMGARFTIAVDFLLFLGVKWPQLKERIHFSTRAKKEKRLIVIGAIILGLAFLYIAGTRAAAASYTPLERKAFYPGDMVVRPFWKNLYDSTNGRVGGIITMSDYLGEAPYIFSYYCKYGFPNKVFGGQFLFRSIIQIFHSLTGIGPTFSSLSSQIMSGQYTGFAYLLIADFGFIGSFFAAFFIGRLIAVIERESEHSKICNLLYAPVRVMCFFAPIFYFYIGRIDYTILGILIFSPLCLKTIRGSAKEAQMKGLSKTDGRGNTDNILYRQKVATE